MRGETLRTCVLGGILQHYLHESAMMSAYLLRVSVSLTRKLQRTFCTSLAWRKPFPLTTTWKDSEAGGSFQNKSLPNKSQPSLRSGGTGFVRSASLPPSQMLEGSTARISMQDLLRIWEWKSKNVHQHHITFRGMSDSPTPYRVNDALQGLETIVDWKDVVPAVRYGRELQRNMTKWRFIVL